MKLKVSFPNPYRTAGENYRVCGGCRGVGVLDTWGSRNHDREEDSMICVCGPNHSIAVCWVEL